MPSARGSQIPMVIAALATALSAATYARLEAVKEDISQNTGAVIATEDVYGITTSEKPEFCLRNNSGAYLCHQRAQIAQSGTYVMRGEMNPGLSSGAVLHSVTTQCSTKTSAQTGSIVINKYSKSRITSAQSVLRHYVRLAAGNVTRVSTGTYVIPYDGYLSFITATGASLVGGDCVLDMWYSDVYDR